LPDIGAAYRHLLPWFLPGLLVFSLLGAAIARPVGRLFRASPGLGFSLVFSLGIVLAATLTPLRGAFNSNAVGGTCDLSRIGLAPLRLLLHIDDTSLNIAMFVPFGIVVGLLGRSRAKAVLVVVAIALPVLIETTQLLVPSLERGCQSADVFDNLTGLALGLLFGTVLRWILDRQAVEPDPTPPGAVPPAA
jgi:hypothetical protein